MPAMEIVLRYAPGCPNRDLAESRLREALGGRDVPIALERVEAPDGTEPAGFPGSPTILVDGRDPFGGQRAEGGPSCRLYRTEAGVEGAPSVAQLREVLG